MGGSDVPKLTDRPTGEIIRLLLASVICFVVVLESIVIGFVGVLHPNANTTASLHIVFDVVGVMLGAVVGYGAGTLYGGSSKPSGGQQPVGRDDDAGDV